jgi:ectoine hydroxylase-related dioxygenase (phytanoyl-CoA dioxygenase family)
MSQITNTAGLTEGQIDFHKTFGYTVLKQLFSADELPTIRKEFDTSMADQYAHTPYDGTERHWAPLMDEETPFFASLMEDPRLLTVARQLYGDDVLGIGTDANRYTGDTRWHRDTRTVHQYGVKFAFYLQPVGANTGALRVIPGTHRLPNDDQFASGVQSLPLEQVPCAVLTSEPGDVVAFDLRMWHASYGGSDDRHMCTIVYYSNPKDPEGLEALRRQGEGNSSVKELIPTRPYLYSKRWVSNPYGSPVRQAWIDRLTEVGYFDAPGLVEA